MCGILSFVLSVNSKDVAPLPSGLYVSSLHYGSFGAAFKMSFLLPVLSYLFFIYHGIICSYVLCCFNLEVFGFHQIWSFPPE